MELAAANSTNIGTRVFTTRLCKARGEIVAANEVDHIVRIVDGGDRLDPGNLQSASLATAEDRR
jgi:hypothetical protein